MNKMNESFGVKKIELQELGERPRRVDIEEGKTISSVRKDITYDAFNYGRPSLTKGSINYLHESPDRPVNAEGNSILDMGMGEQNYDEFRNAIYQDLELEENTGIINITYFSGCDERH